MMSREALTHRQLLLSLVLLGATGCDADCEDPSRLDNGYVVYSNFTSDRWELTGFDSDAREEQLVLLQALFVNGWSEWDLRYVPGEQVFEIFLDDQPYTATYSQSEENCNSFRLAFSGTFTSTESSIHDFEWIGNLSYFGTHLGGTFTYTDSWRTSSHSGTTFVRDAEMRANQRGGSDSGIGATAWD